MALKAKLSDINKKFKIKNVHDVADEDLASYVETQINEMKAVLVRLRIDYLLNQEISTDGEAERQGRDDKMRALAKDVKQFVETIDILSELSKDLKK